MHLSSEEHQRNKENFKEILEVLYNILIRERKNIEKVNEYFEFFLEKLNSFDIEMLPYSSASRFIYQLPEDDEEYFFNDLVGLAEKYFEKYKDENLYIKFTKFYEHLDLASSQKAFLYIEQQQQLSQLVEKMNQVREIVKSYDEKKESLEAGIKEFETVKTKFEELSTNVEQFNPKIKKYGLELQEFEKKFEKVEQSTEQITVTLISILGIFAAILLGAYGAIQGFSNIFANAADMNTGKILILSSIGGSAVLLILFFLLSSIAKMTDRNFGNGGNAFVTKHPIMFYSHCLLFIVFSCGAVLELINSNVTPDKSWLWIIILLLVIIQILFVASTKSLWGILLYLIEIKSNFKNVIVFFILLIMLLLNLAFWNGYI